MSGYNSCMFAYGQVGSPVIFSVFGWIVEAILNFFAFLFFIFILLQTGSGKTYTMMGELSEIVDGLSGDCGMTPRIFEYLFTRISDVRS